MAELESAATVARPALDFGASAEARAAWPEPHSLQRGDRVVCRLGGSVIHGVLLGINTYACWATVRPDGSGGHMLIETPWQIVAEAGEQRG